MFTEIIYDSRTKIYEIWVWFGQYSAERRAHRKTLNAARNAALKYGPIRRVVEI